MAEAAHFHMPVFKPGTAVLLAGKSAVINYIVVRRNLLIVHLVGHDSPVHSDKLEVEPTLFTRVRV